MRTFVELQLKWAATWNFLWWKVCRVCTTQTVRAQLRRAHLVSIDTRQHGIAGKPNSDVALSTHAAPCHVVPPCGRGVGHVHCARHRHVLHTRVCASQARAYCPLACCHLQRCVILLCHQWHCHAAHWGRGCLENLSESTQIPCTLPAWLLPLRCLSPHCCPPLHPLLLLTLPKQKLCFQQSYQTISDEVIKARSINTSSLTVLTTLINRILVSCNNFSLSTSSYAILRNVDISWGAQARTPGLKLPWCSHATCKPSSAKTQDHQTGTLTLQSLWHTQKHTHTRSHTHTSTHAHTGTHTHSHTNTQTHNHTHTHTHKHTPQTAHTHTHAHTNTHTYTHTHTHTHTVAHTHTQTHSHSHSHTRARTHALTHKYSQSVCLSVCQPACLYLCASQTSALSNQSSVGQFVPELLRYLFQHRLFYWFQGPRWTWKDKKLVVVTQPAVPVTCFLSQVTLQLTLESFGEAVYSSLTWGPPTSREAVVTDCQSAIYKATRPVYWIGSHKTQDHSPHHTTSTASPPEEVWDFGRRQQFQDWAPCDLPWAAQCGTVLRAVYSIYQARE